MATVALGIRHVLCAPLRLMRYVESGEQEQLDRVIGVLYLDSRERGALRSATVQAALETLSAEAALAIENARLYREALDKAKIDQELKVAAAIQQSLLPPGEHNGDFFSAFAASEPCRSVGGDFFDYIELPTGGVVLGLFEAATFEQEKVMLEKGDVLLTFSDGVTEAMNEASEEFGDDHLVSLMRDRHNQDPRKILEELLAEVKKFCGDAV